jgi:hypothetical protein
MAVPPGGGARIGADRDRLGAISPQQYPGAQRVGAGIDQLVIVDEVGAGCRHRDDQRFDVRARGGTELASGRRMSRPSTMNVEENMKNHTIISTSMAGSG